MKVENHRHTLVPSMEAEEWNVVHKRIMRYWERHVQPNVRAFYDSWLSDFSVESPEVDVAALVLGLPSMNKSQRASALEKIAKVDPAALAEHESSIEDYVADEVGLVRAAALQALGNIYGAQILKGELPALTKYRGTVVRHFHDACADVRLTCVENCIQQLSSQRISGFANSISMIGFASSVVGRVADTDERVRAAAISLIGLFSLEEQSARIHVVVDRFKDCHEDVRCAALRVVSNMENAVFLKQVPAITNLIGDESAMVRALAIESLMKLEPELYSQSASRILSRFSDESVCVRQKAVAAFHKLAPVVLPAYGSQFVKWIASKDKTVKAAVLQTISRHPASLLHVKDENGDTALHIAAREGDLETCCSLVRLGALIKTKNWMGQTPETLAQQGHHITVCRFFNRFENVTTTRGGLGDALADALADTRPITRVEWHMIPLPGFAGYLGGIHSLLAVTVGLQETSDIHTYVMEKAARVRGTIQDDPEQFKNGVHVSHWVDVLPNVESDALYTLGLADIVNNTGCDDFCMRVLRNICVDLGPYDVGVCNCHHAALVVFNACARESARVPVIPNFYLTSTAWFLGGLGIDVANSGSASVQSHSVSASVSTLATTSVPVSQSLASESFASQARPSQASNTQASSDSQCMPDSEDNKLIVSSSVKNSSGCADRRAFMSTDSASKTAVGCTCFTCVSFSSLVIALGLAPAKHH